jgi:signal transduction histidine kinase/ActR/RegA family two-component response regulator
MLGYTPSELAGQHWKIITPLDQQPLVLAADQRRLRGESDQYELELVDKNGQRLAVLVSGSPRFVNGRLVGTLSVFTDITARKQIERDRESLLTHIYEQAQRIQQIIAAVPAGVCVLDADQRIVLANPVAEKDLLVLAMAHPGDRLTHLGDRSLTDLLTSPPKGLWHEVKAPGRTFEIIARPIENFPIPQSWVLVINDATREREVQQRLQIQEQLATVGQLAAGIAHDFNNIMAVIVLYADMALLASDLSAKSRQQLQTIALQARRATDLIQQILDFGRRAVLERRPIDLAPFLKEQVKLLKRTLPENIAIHLSYSAGKFVVEADPTRIQQVIMNLSVNARDAMPEGGELRIGLEHLHLEHPDQVPLPGMKTGEWIRITVTDTGAGISPKVMPRIFEPFFTTKAPWGTGLGLSQVHGIVKQHGGEIDVTSKIGEGATFIIYLPAIAEAEPEALLLEKTSLSQGHGEMILIVEDEAVIRSALTETLALLNYRSLEAPNGRHALEILEQQADIDLIITDAIMPEMGGIALLQALKERGIAVPVVMLTGHLMEADLKKLQAQGLKAWMSKPPRIEKLAQVVAQALQPPE